MDDMPTIEQLKKYQIEVLKNSASEEEKNNSYFYIESGLNRYISQHGNNPYSALFVPVVPIKSVPVDADGDNDGVPDFCDLNKLRKGDLLSDLNDACGKRNIDTFTVIKEFSTPVVLSKKHIIKLMHIHCPKLSLKRRLSTPITQMRKFIYMVL